MKETCGTRQRATIAHDSLRNRFAKAAALAMQHLFPLGVAFGVLCGGICVTAAFRCITSDYSCNSDAFRAYAESVLVETPSGPKNDLGQTPELYGENQEWAYSAEVAPAI